ALDTLASGKELPPELKGSTMRAGTGPAPFDFAGAAMEMSGGRGAATIATTLDHITMTDAQRAGLLPPLAKYLASIQKFREMQASLKRGRGRDPWARGGGAPETAPATAKANPADGEPSPATEEDVQAALSAMEAAADRLKVAIKDNVNTK